MSGSLIIFSCMLCFSRSYSQILIHALIFHKFLTSASRFEPFFTCTKSTILIKTSLQVAQFLALLKERENPFRRRRTALFSCRAPAGSTALPTGRDQIKSSQNPPSRGPPCPKMPPNQKAPAKRQGPGCPRAGQKMQISALGELRRAAGSLEAVLQSSER